MAVAVLAAAVGVWAVAASRGGGTPVGQLAARATPARVDLTWRAPTEGIPASYRIERNGNAIGRVGAGTLHFADTHVAPGTRYTYEVFAIVDGHDTDAAQVSVRTGVPPVAAAVLGGNYRVRIVTTAAEGWEHLHAGHRDTEYWTFSQGGGRLAGQTETGSWTMQIGRQGGAVHGTTRASLSTCWITPVTDTLSFQGHVTAGRVLGGVWRATRFTGTLHLVSPSATSGLYTCGGSSYTASIEGVRT